MRSDKVARKEHLPPRLDYGLHLRHSVETQSQPIAGRLREEVNRWTRSQSERRGKDTGRRQTNVRRHRKGEPASITDRAGDFGSRPFVQWGKAATIREENGNAHLMARRCKRRRHVLEVPSSNWGGPVQFRRRLGYDD